MSYTIPESHYNGRMHAVRFNVGSDYLEKVAAYTAAGFTHGSASEVGVLLVYYRPDPSCTYRTARPAYPKRYRDKCGWK